MAARFAVSSSGRPPGIGASPLLWLLALGLPASICLQLRALNGALAAFGALEVVPTYQAAIVVFGLAFGWVAYEENAGLSAQAQGLFGAGCALSVAGIGLLMLKPPPGGGGRRGGGGEGEGGEGGGEGEGLDKRLLLASGSGGGYGSGGGGGGYGAVGSGAGASADTATHDSQRALLGAGRGAARSL